MARAWRSSPSSWRGIVEKFTLAPCNIALRSLAKCRRPSVTSMACQSASHCRQAEVMSVCRRGASPKFSAPAGEDTGHLCRDALAGIGNALYGMKQAWRDRFRAETLARRAFARDVSSRRRILLAKYLSFVPTMISSRMKNAIEYKTSEMKLTSSRYLHDEFVADAALAKSSHCRAVIKPRRRPL